MDHVIMSESPTPEFVVHTSDVITEYGPEVVSISFLVCDDEGNVFGEDFCTLDDGDTQSIHDSPHESENDLVDDKERKKKKRGAFLTPLVIPTERVEDTLTIPPTPGVYVHEFPWPLKRSLAVDEDTNEPTPKAPRILERSLAVDESEPNPITPSTTIDLETIKCLTSGEPAERTDEKEPRQTLEDRKGALLGIWLRYLKTNSKNAHMFKDVKNPTELPALIYSASKNYHDFWVDIKLTTMGMNHWMKLVSTTSPAALSVTAPVQYGGLKGFEKTSFLSEKDVVMGAYGEWWVAKHVIEWWVGGAMYYDTPGKICHGKFHVVTTTPDYTFHTGERTEWSATRLIDFPKGPVTGVGECKTSNITREEHDAGEWNKEGCTVHDILLTKPKYIQTMFLGGTQRTPKWLGGHPELLKTIQEDIAATTQWYIKDGADEDAPVRAFDMSDQGNKIFLRPFSNDPGQQMFAECMSVTEYVEGDKVKLHGFFPSALLVGDAVLPKQQEEDDDDFPPEDDDEFILNILTKESKEEEEEDKKREEEEIGTTSTPHSEIANSPFKFQISYCLFFTAEFNKTATLEAVYEEAEPLIISRLSDIATIDGHDLSKE